MLADKLRNAAMIQNAQHQVFGAPSVGAAAYLPASSNSFYVNYPAGITSTDALVIFVGRKPSVENAGDVIAPAGWSTVTSFFGGGYGATLLSDQGNTQITVLKKDSVTGSESGQVQIQMTTSTNSVAWGTVARIPTEGDEFVLSTFGGDDSSSGNVSAYLSPSVDVAIGDLLIWGMCVPTDAVGSNFSNHAVSIGAQTLNGQQFGVFSSFAGSDIGGFVAYAIADENIQSSAPLVSATAGGVNTNARGPICLIRFR